MVLGKGFILTPAEAFALINKDPRNKEVLYPYLNGDDLNNSPTQDPSRWVINFLDWSEEKARSYPDCFDIVERLVKPERFIQKDKGAKEKWWQFLRSRKELYATISELDQVMVITRVSKYFVTTFIESSNVFMDKIVVLTFEEKGIFAILQSTIYDCWVWKNTSTIGSNGINFAPNDCFENFAFPKDIENLADLGNAYLLSRKELMLKTQLGLTKIYNLFHSSGISEEINENDKQVKLLRNHLIKIDINTSFEEVIDGIKRLRLLHKLIDEAVIKEYGWTDINLQNDFYDVEYLPEIDRIRYTIHPKARKEILKRLLMLNHQRYKEEVSENSKTLSLIIKR
ncbi:hypothetical protein EG345_12395 [Chryseobacterium carnipullorum]|nr:hypothetical protein EG345_12395 [Chryseobacterium carnipullorum]